MGDRFLKQLNAVEGAVKWFDNHRGFGFIEGPEGQDIFLHYTAIQCRGFKDLKDGTIVQYDAVKTTQGWRATQVQQRDLVGAAQVDKKMYARTSRR